MVISKNINQLIKMQDFVHLVILSAVALCIGIYIIVTTTLIAKDGVSYINYAKGLSVAPVKVIRDCTEYAPSSYAPGYPFLILVTHKLIGLFGDSSAVSCWIFSAQAAALLCRILALIPLYFIGKELVGGKLSFWAILILVILPAPAKFGSDALWDWPHILFLATGFLLLLWAARYEKWQVFGLIGVVTGLGYLIRPMCVQLLVYGVLWLVFNLFRGGNKYGLSRIKIVGGLALLVTGFLIVAVPYMKIRGEILPTRFQQIIEEISFDCNGDETACQEADIYQAKIIPVDVAKMFYELIDEISTNLMYFFAPFWFVGMYCYIRKKPKNDSFIFITAFILLNITALVLRYHINSDLSGRYVLPLVTFTIFFVPVGLHVAGREIDKLLCKTVCKNDSSEVGARRWFFILLVIGLVICLPKLFRPLRIEKKGYRLAAEWLKENSGQDDFIVVPDKRISFYSGHSGHGRSVETSTLLNSSVFSCLAWLKPSGETTKIIKEGTANDPLFKINEDSTLSLVKQNVIGIGVSTGKVTKDVWNHAAVTYDAAGNYNFYINGCAAGEGNNLQRFVFGDTLLGKNWGEQSGNGQLGNVLVIDKILSNEEIAGFYAEGIKPEDKIRNLETGLDVRVKYFVKKLEGCGKSPTAMTEKWSGYLNEKSKKTRVVIYGRI